MLNCDSSERGQHENHGIVTRNVEITYYPKALKHYNVQNVQNKGREVRICWEANCAYFKAKSSTISLTFFSLISFNLAIRKCTSSANSSCNFSSLRTPDLEKENM